eukprot:scaffold659364_cov57-Prasinocladus_malaysianus.AAC.1
MAGRSSIAVPAPSFSRMPRTSALAVLIFYTIFLKSRGDTGQNELKVISSGILYGPSKEAAGTTVNQQGTRTERGGDIPASRAPYDFDLASGFDIEPSAIPQWPCSGQGTQYCKNSAI